MYYLTEVDIEGSFLKGYIYKRNYWRDDQKRENVRVGDEVLIPINQIKEMEVDKFNPYITVALVLGIPTAIMVILLAINGFLL